MIVCLLTATPIPGAVLANRLPNVSTTYVVEEKSRRGVYGLGWSTLPPIFRKWSEMSWGADSI